MTARAVEIDRVKHAMATREGSLSDLREEARGACCPSCFHGAKYRDLAAKQERTRWWLAILLTKAGEADFAQAVKIGAWP